MKPSAISFPVRDLPKVVPGWLLWARLVWIAYALIVLVLNIWIIPYRMSQVVTIGWPEWSHAASLKALAELGISQGVLAGINNWVNLLTPFLYLSLAAMIFWKRSKDPAGLLWAAMFVTFWSPFTDLGKIYPAWKLFGEIHDAFGTALSFAALYSFPDGRFKPGWTRWVALCNAAIQAWRPFQPDLYSKVFPFFAVVLFLSIPVALVYRYARLSSASQRQQIKWVVFGLAVCTIPLAIFLLVFLSTPALHQPTAAGMAAFLIGNYLWLAVAWGLPLSFFMAIFRSGLWDIDLVIRRTLVYSILTVLLGLVYYGGVTFLQSLFSSVSGQQSPAALVISTLLIAALFSPLRRRIQDFIDRRFYRQKYNAEKALAAFAAAARSETDMERLSTKLVYVAQETLQPQRLSLWIRKSSKLHVFKE